MADKTTTQAFTTDWRKTLSWGQENNVPKPALTAVYNLDLQRLNKGTNIMSSAERYRAILSAAGMKNYNTLPTTTNTASPGSLVNDARNTLANIFTGLNPVGLFHNLFDTVKNTVEHPETTIKEVMGTKKAVETAVLHPTKSLLTQFVPGLLDVYRVEAGGINTLTKNPISSLLDVASVGSIAGAALKGAGIDLAETAASRLGVSTEELGKDSIYRNLARIVGSAKNPATKAMSLGVDDSTGEITYTPQTISQTLQTWALKHNVGSIPGHLMEGALTIREKQTFLSQQELEPLVKIFSTMTDDKRAMVNGLVTKSGQIMKDRPDLLDATTEKILTTDLLPLNVRTAVKYYEQKIREPLQEYALSTGKVSKLTMPTGKQEIYSGQAANTVQSAADATNKALSKLEDRRQEAEKITTESTLLDRHRTQVMTQLGKMQTAIWSYVTATIPGESSDVADLLRTTVSQQTAPGISRAMQDRIYRQGNQDKIYRMVTREGSDLSKETLQKLGLSDDQASVRGTAPLTKTNARLITEIFKPGGLIDTLKSQILNKDFAGARETASTLSRRLHGKRAQEIHIKAAPQLMTTLRDMSKELKEITAKRKTLEDSFQTIMSGRTSKKARNISVDKLLVAYNKNMKQWQKAVFDNYPPVYRPMYLDILTRKIIEHEKTPEFLAAARDELKSNGWSDENLDKLGSTPRNYLELISSISESTYNDPLVGQTFVDIKAEVENSAKKELSELRARPTADPPHYVPAITTHDLGNKELAMYDVYLGKLDRDPGISSTHERQLFNYGATVNNFLAAVTHATKEQLGRDGVLEYHDNFLRPLSYTQSDLEKMILKSPVFQERLAGQSILGESRGAILEDIYKRTLGLVQWSPDKLFGFHTGRVLPGTDNQLWIPKSIHDTVTSIIEKHQFPMTGTIDKITNLFRFSVLGLSPRFFLHVSVGGTYMLAGKISPTTFSQIGNAYRMVKDGTLDDSVMHSITQEGNEYIAYHYMAGRTWTKMAIESRLQAMGIDPKYAAVTTWVKAGANLNFTMTRFIGNMQRALAFFDGVKKSGSQLNFVKDEEGKTQLVTSDRALYEGRKSVARVMGDLRAMSPFERQYMTKIMPFYGWNKHVLKYVLTMPIDHPFRAQIFANMAETNSQDVQDGLPTRIQLLFFLGSPNKQGTVTALTDRFSDPLRTVANYASISGVISSLNPLATAAFAYVDPQIIYGSNTLYPTVTYTHVFGVKTGKASGNLLTSAEQIVPELGAIDVAFGLSSQYRDLAKKTPAAFKKDIFEALNIPFANVQHFNLKQLAARQEIDRYTVAESAATTAWRTGTFAGVKGYSTLPLPLNDIYNVTPDQLQSIYQDSINQYGLPPQDTMKEPKSPPLL